MLTMARMGHHPSAIPETINKGEFEMSIIRKLCLASILALPFAAPVQAQNPQEGDYYAPGPTTPIHATPGQTLKLKDGDYYVGDTMVLDHKRMAALKECTSGRKFAFRPLRGMHVKRAKLPSRQDRGHRYLVVSLLSCADRKRDVGFWSMLSKKA